MSVTRPDSDPAETTTSSESVAKSTSHVSDPAGFSEPGTIASPSSSTPPTSAILTTPTTSAASTFSTITISSSTLEAFSSSTTSAGLESTSTTSINWGPAITASPLPTTATVADVSPSTSSPTSTSRSHDGLSKRAKDITISTTVIGGVLIIALLLYALYRRKQGASASEIVHFRRHRPSTVCLTPGPREPRLTALPIYRESRYSVRSSKHASVASFPKSMRKTASVPHGVAQNFHHQNPYVRSLWKTAHPPSAPRSPLREAHSSAGASTSNQATKEADKSQVTIKTVGSRKSKQASRDTAKSMAISISELPLTEPETEAATPPESPTTPRNPQERWSWTNSQAPTTPRMYAPSLRSSIASLPRFRNIKSWVRGQTERIPEEQKPLPAKKQPNLKNKASLPTLAPAVTRKLSKKHGRVGSLSSIFTQHPGTKFPYPTSPREEEQRPVTAPAPTAALEMRQLSR